MSVRRITFVIEEFSIGGPTQQLLDRFIIGYNRDGEFHRPESQISVAVPTGFKIEMLQSRMREHRLRQAQMDFRTVRDIDAFVFASGSGFAFGNPSLLEGTLLNMQRGARCFVLGRLANDPVSAKRIQGVATLRGVILSAGTAAATPFLLPEIRIPPDSHMSEALIVTQGRYPSAEIDALEALQPFIETRHGAQSEMQEVRWLEGNDVWEAGQAGLWSRLLLSAAFSRSNNIKGDPEKDGRTQDVAGLGLIDRLAKNPRALLITHADGFRYAILVLDGAIGDTNMAIRFPEGRIVSTQLYRPPLPMNDQYSLLAGVVEDYFNSSDHPWPQQRSFLISEVISRLNPRIPNV
jgi:hypothetical protein